MCGLKDRCRDGNLSCESHLVWLFFFVEASPTCFCIFVMLFQELVSGNFWGGRGFHTYMFFELLSFSPVTCFCCFFGGGGGWVREII